MFVNFFFQPLEVRDDVISLVDEVDKVSDDSDDRESDGEKRWDVESLYPTDIVPGNYQEHHILSCDSHTR